MLAVETFLGVVKHTPLVAVDCVLVRGGAEVLLGLRNNRPAQGHWFVPGDRGECRRIISLRKTNNREKLNYANTFDAS